MLAIAVLWLALAFGCSAKAPEVSEAPPSEQVTATAKECSDPRPQLCTRDYRPVCAMRDTGIRCVKAPCPASEWTTYGNACSACSDPKVMRWVAGECTDPPEAESSTE